MNDVFFQAPGVQTATALAAMAACLGLWVAYLSKRRLRHLWLPLVAGLALDQLVFVARLMVQPQLVSDEVTWHTLAARAAAYIDGSSSVAVHYYAGKEGYVWILGAAYALAGISPLVAVAMNILAHAVIVACVASTAERLGGLAGLGAGDANRRALLAGLLAAVLPVFSWWSVFVLRETLTWLTIAASLLIVTVAATRGRGWIYFLALVPLSVLYWVRGNLGIAMAAAVVSGIGAGAVLRFWLRGRHSSRCGVVLTMAVAAVASVLSLAIAAGVPRLADVAMAALGPGAANTAGGTSGGASATVSSNTEGSVPGVGDGKSIENEIEQESAVTTAALSTAASGFEGLSSSASMLEIASVTAPRVALGPFPWEWRLTPVMLLALMELFCWLATALLALSWFWSRERRRLATIVRNEPVFVVVALTLLGGIVFIVGNYGILARFRPIATLALIPLAAMAAGGARTMGTRRSGAGTKADSGGSKSEDFESGELA